MARLRYFAMTSLDGYVADEAGGFDWAAPDEEVHAYVNDRMRDVGTYLYGRRMYETMVYWETADTGEAVDTGETGGTDLDVGRDFAEIWRAADKIVYSTTLARTASARTRLERSFEPEQVRLLLDGAAQDVAIGGPGIAAEALRCGLVDELEVITVPALVGGGTGWLPRGVRADLELVAEHRFSSGSVDLRYRVRR